MGHAPEGKDEAALLVVRESGFLHSAVPFGCAQGPSPVGVTKFNLAKKVSLLGFAASGGSADVIEGDGASAEEDQREGQGSQGQGEFVAAVAH